MTTDGMLCFVCLNANWPNVGKPRPAVALVAGTAVCQQHVRRVKPTTWLTVAEATVRIKAKHPRLVRDAVKAGYLPAFTYGKSDIRIDEADLDEWIRSRPWEEAS